MAEAPGGDREECWTIEIRSYRQVFALERRLYRIEGLRLNPGGIPLRGVGCFLTLACAGLVLATVPLLGDAVMAVPWYLREGAMPALGAFLFTTVRVEGRPLHVAALALIRWRLGTRELAGLGADSRSHGRRDHERVGLRRRAAR
ncbi:MAG: hypothetical protein ACTHM1_00060 [Solirubrobacteraceae bacterium]